jgi:hypothetical protein
VDASHPFLGNAGTGAPQRLAYSLNPDPLTPQPSAGRASNVAPPGKESLVRELKKDPGVDNPFALAWWITGRQK